MNHFVRLSVCMSVCHTFFEILHSTSYTFYRYTYKIQILEYFVLNKFKSLFFKSYLISAKIYILPIYLENIKPFTFKNKNVFY